MFLYHLLVIVCVPVRRSLMFTSPLMFPGGTFVVTLGTSEKSETMTCRLSNNHRQVHTSHADRTLQPDDKKQHVCWHFSCPVFSFMCRHFEIYASESSAANRENLWPFSSVNWNCWAESICYIVIYLLCCRDGLSLIPLIWVLTYSLASLCKPLLTFKVAFTLFILTLL